MENKDIKSIFKNLSLLKMIKADTAPKLEGISFRYKTVQFHLIDDLFEEIERSTNIFGNTKIYSERFSLPGYGIKTEDLTGQEFQYEIIIGIESNVNKEVYLAELEKVINKIEEKHGVDIVGEPYVHEGEEAEEAYNVHRIIFYTNEEGIFPKE